MKISLQQIKTGFSGEYCYTHARGAVMPDGKAVITTQKLRLTGCDIFSGLEMTTSCDSGRSWGDIVLQEPLKRRDLGGGVEQTFCDATPFYHKKSGKLILTGHEALYLNDKLFPPPRPRHTLWSVFDEKSGTWGDFKVFNMPDEEKYFSCGSGCGQIWELDNGELLIPVYFRSRKEAENPWQTCYQAMVMRCGFDGHDIHLLETGTPMSTTVPRGLCEPSITWFNGRFFLALRNDKQGFVASSDDGLNFCEPRVLSFDDGRESGNYCTQQHWLLCGKKLFLVYTRKGADNDHVFRHRAPLFIAEFDPDKMCLIRESEMVAVPERGARLGNFGCTNVSENEAWVVAAEWMQTTGPDSGNWRRCASFGSDNSIFIARVYAD